MLTARGWFDHKNVIISFGSNACVWHLNSQEVIAPVLDLSSAVKGTESPEIGVLEDIDFALHVSGILSLGIGESKLCMARLDFSRYGKDYQLGFQYTRGDGSSPLLVTRTSPGQLVIETSAASGDIGRLTQRTKKGLIHVGWYHVPGRFEVNLDTSPQDEAEKSERFPKGLEVVDDREE
jgi:hypothetical protein